MNFVLSGARLNEHELQQAWSELDHGNFTGATDIILQSADTTGSAFSLYEITLTIAASVRDAKLAALSRLRAIESDSLSPEEWDRIDIRTAHFILVDGAEEITDPAVLTFYRSSDLTLLGSKHLISSAFAARNHDDVTFRDSIAAARVLATHLSDDNNAYHLDFNKCSVSRWEARGLRRLGYEFEARNLEKLLDADLRSRLAK